MNVVLFWDHGQEESMIDPVESLILDLLEWVANGERSYDEVMEAWRTSCPRFPVWEDANDRALVTKTQMNGRLYVRITSSGLALLEQHSSRSTDAPLEIVASRISKSVI
jgi:hypothetical protein